MTRRGWCFSCGENERGGACLSVGQFVKLEK
nr:MAG TPA: Putative GTPase activating protein [Caudoviricetes sp.]